MQVFGIIDQQEIGFPSTDSNVNVCWRVGNEERGKERGRERGKERKEGERKRDAGSVKRMEHERARKSNRRDEVLMTYAGRASVDTIFGYHHPVPRGCQIRCQS